MPSEMPVPSEVGPGPLTTVIIATRNRREDLLRHLPRHERPVIVVDNASTDGTADAVAARHPHVRVLRLRRNRGAFARTVGARAAGTPYVAFADDDSWWAAGALAQAERVFAAHPRLGLLAGAILVGPSEDLDPLNAVLAASPLPRRAGSPGPELLGFVGCGAIARRRAFLQVGGFDAVVRFPGEEERVALDLHDAGWVTAYVPRIVAHHHPAWARDSAPRRRAGLARSRVLTAVLRRPWGDVRAEVRAASSTPEGRRGLLGAFPRLPAALRHRRVVAAPTLAAAELLARGAAAEAAARP